MAPKGVCQNLQRDSLTPAQPLWGQLQQECNRNTAGIQQEYKNSARRCPWKCGLCSTGLRKGLHRSPWELRDPRFPRPMTREKNLILLTKRRCLLFSAIHLSVQCKRDCNDICSVKGNSTFIVGTGNSLKCKRVQDEEN